MRTFNTSASTLPDLASDNALARIFEHLIRLPDMQAPPDFPVCDPVLLALISEDSASIAKAFHGGLDVIANTLEHLRTQGGPNTPNIDGLEKLAGLLISMGGFLTALSALSRACRHGVAQSTFMRPN